MICIGITIGIGPSGALLHTIGIGTIIGIGIGVGQWKCTITVKVYHCVNGDSPFDGQIIFGTNSVHPCKFYGDGMCKQTFNLKFSCVINIFYVSLSRPPQISVNSPLSLCRSNPDSAGLPRIIMGPDSNHR